MEMKKLPVIEIFGPTIQGEGALAGMRSHFIRLGGCTYRCSWCDSMHAVDPREIILRAIKLDRDQIITRIKKLKPSLWITLSGGDPCMHNLTELISKLKFIGYKVAIETQGAFFPSWIKYCQVVTVSPKAPSSNMLDKLDHDILSEYHQIGLAYRGQNSPSIYFKIVCRDREDIEFARMIHKKYNGIPFFISVVTPIGISDAIGKDIVLDRMRDLMDIALEYDDLADITILPQLHYLAWGAQLGK